MPLRHYTVRMSNELTAQQEQACDMQARGSTLTEICQALRIDIRTLAKQRAQVPAFDREFASARKLAADALADGLLEVRDAEKWPDVQRAKAWADSVKWLLARRHRDEYGDRVDVGVTVTVNLADALREAKARALRPMSDPAPAIEGECVDISTQYERGRIDCESKPPAPGGFETPPAPDIFS